MAHKELVYSFHGHACPSCQALVIEAIGDLPRVHSVKQKGQRFTLVVEEPGPTLQEIRSVVQTIEPGLDVVEEEHHHETKGALWELAVALLLTLIAFGLRSPAREIAFVLAYIAVGYPVVHTALAGLCRGNLFNENTLMSIATIGAIFLGNHLEAIAVMFFYRIGELLEHLAVHRSQKSISSLLELWPEKANLVKNGQIQEVDPDQLQIDDVIIIKPGEKVPTDALILEGYSKVDTAALTGESMPKDMAVQDTLLSGMVNLSSVLKAKVIRPMNESAAAKIVELVEEARKQKAPTEKFITRFARYYTPVVVALALAIGVVPPLVGFGEFPQWIYRSLVFLVISCPCALVLSIPLSFFAGIGKAASEGVLVRGGNYLEGLSKLDTIVFDKTGTLTTGEFHLSGIHPQNDFTPEDLLRYAAYAESFSNHPIAQSILSAAALEGPLLNEKIIHEEIPGMGIKAVKDGQEILVGNEKLMDYFQVPYATGVLGTAVHVAVGGKYAGWVGVADTIKKNTQEAIQLLRKEGVGRMVMLTGDASHSAQTVATKLGLDEFHAELLPADKVDHLERLLSTSNGTTAFVGDGINDAPVLAQADIGIAMGQVGSDAAVGTADVVLMHDQPGQLVLAVQIAKQTKRIAQQNIAFALGVKVLVLILGAFGLSTLWEAIFADVGVTLLAVLNAMRIARFEPTGVCIRS
ncbi:MAG: cadmium-translocating P-type ATPase [Limnochordia bacterium]|jgi:Cd2+/Zn2+-exporting ATPase|nr:cadmium-translocating P-type ATPase [Limnochordia bacterium]MDD4517683.1 heavy metal translocating P-type ATPase [Limnochordia bacterium]